MKALLVGECRDGKLLGSTYEAVAFAERLGAPSAMVLVGEESALPAYDGTVYLGPAGVLGEYDPAAHKALVLAAVERERPDLVVFCHSSYGWDLAPRVALALGAGQVSEVVGYAEGAFVTPACNAKLRRTVRPQGPVTVVTLQAGAFALAGEPAGTPRVEKLEAVPSDSVRLVGYEAAAGGGVDLGRSEVIVSAGRGIGKPENLALVEALARALKGEYGASRPVVDAGWAEHHRQVGSTGQTVAPKLYLACGISGAIQHLAGMKKSEFVVAVNTDKEAPIGEVADVLVVADLKQFLPALTARIQG